MTYRPCPFCSYDSQILTTVTCNSGTMKALSCQQCGANGPYLNSSVDRAVLEDSWNGSFTDMSEISIARFAQTRGVITTFTHNFAQYPTSITELKARKAGDGKYQTPRDAAVRALRDIDENIMKPTSAILVFHRPIDSPKKPVSIYNATPDGVTALGLLMSAVKWFQ